ncbi:hypothetical protein [Capnocytophaga sp.]|uniref:hypothetical protein n=1 Tax=Capnocytophaga sp. TaxID=44737 RepID=UPI0026DB7041|nr:hypothetical protein [Capnocytophaga sp.]MDO5104328.1 hypothetical protein [Capnocytophaga sp.]
MKKIRIITSIFFLAFASCSKGGNDTEDTPPPVIDPDAFSFSIKNIFNHPEKNLTNIQVGDYIPFAIEIGDTQDNASYSLLLIKENQKHHQTLGKDYELYVDNEKGEKQKMNIQKNDALNYVVFDKKGKHYFYIKPLLPGTFKHVYELQKQVDGKIVGSSKKQEILFNSVLLSVWFEREETQSAGLFQHSKHKNNFYFKIDDGIEQDDTYLTSQNGITQRYYIEYDGKVHEGDFNQGTIKFTESHEQEVSPPAVHNRKVDKIIIRQLMPSKRQEEIKYYNFNF